MDFWKQYGFYKVDTPILKEFIKQHMAYNTLLVETSPLNEVVGLCRFDVNKEVATCLDVVIRPDYRFKGMLKKFAIRAIRRFPYITILRFERGLKGKPMKEIGMYKFLSLKGMKVNG